MTIQIDAKLKQRKSPLPPFFKGGLELFFFLSPFEKGGQGGFFLNFSHLFYNTSFLSTIRLTFFLTFFLFFIYFPSFSQDNSPQLGVFGSFVLNRHFPDFREIPGIPSCCPSFESGIGFNGRAGLYYAYPLTKSFSLSAGIDYFSKNGLLSATESELINLSGARINGKFEHTLDAVFNTAGLNIGLITKLSNTYNVYLGARPGYIFSNKYEAQEKITEPADRGIFLDTGTPVRNHSKGNIPNPELFSFDIEVGFSAGFPLNGDSTLMLNPGLSYSIGLTDYVKTVSWKISSVTASIGISWLFKPKTELPNEIENEKKEPQVQQEIISLKNNKSDGNITQKTKGNEKNDTTTSGEKIIIKAGIKSVGVIDGEEQPFSRIRIEEFLSKNIKPLLNYIFFDNNSAEIPGRYKQIIKGDTANFSLKKMHNLPTLDCYYEMLNIVGMRLKATPEAKLKITGCNSDENTEKNNIALSLARANAVADYFIKTWNVKTEQIIIESRNLPAKPSNTSEQDGEEENRRVELDCDVYKILEPLTTTDTLREITPPIIRFYSEIQPKIPLRTWKITILHLGRFLKIFEGKDSLPDRVEWNLNGENIPIVLGLDSIAYNLEITDTLGNTYQTLPKTLPIQQQTLIRKIEEHLSDKKINRFSLILFDFDEYRLNPQHSPIIDLVRENIQANSKVKILGYTDRMGEALYNLLLSDKRAKETATALQFKSIKTKAIGESLLLYDNILPEARFYCRTVEIIVENPIEW
ncbi:MAG: OmpA/MotB domain protein [Ignavibacteria bacterium]|nr:OmpA/MotB domain protein [Ignavibacteria bacterium]